MVAAARSSLVSSIIASILCLIIFGSLRFYAAWFQESSRNTLLGGFIGSFIFIFSLTAVSNLEMFVFGNDFQAKFLPEIVGCIILSAVASSFVHRVCGTTCILFSIVGLYFVNRISNKYYSKLAPSLVEQAQHSRKTAGKKNK